MKASKLQPDKVEHTKGKYAIIVSIIGAVALIIGYVINHSPSSASTVTQNNSDGVNANDVHTQINYFTPVTDTKQVTPVKHPEPKEVIKVVYKSALPIVKDTTPKQSSVSINAENALIVTQGQTGGTNTVITPTVDLPPPLVEKSVDSTNIPVNRIKKKFGPDKKVLGNVSIPDTSVTFYKHQVTVKYRSQYALNGIGFLIERKDVVDFSMSFNGMAMSSSGKYKDFPFVALHQPQNNNYVFTIYTLKPALYIDADIEILR